MNRRLAVGTLPAFTGLTLLVVAACTSSEPGDSEPDEEMSSQVAASTLEVEGCNRGDAPFYRTLRAQWPALATAPTVDVGSQGLELALTNDHADDLYADTAAYVLVDGQESELVVSRSQLVRAGGAASLWIHPGSLGVNVSSMLYSGRMRVRTVFRDAAGKQRGAAVADVLSFHPTSTGGVMAYGDEVRRTQFRGGDYASRIPGLDSSVGSVLIANVSEPDDWQTPELIGLPPPVTGYRFCFNFNVTFSDSGVGEDYFTESGAMAAHAISYEISDGTSSFSGFANLDDGCTPDLNFPSGATVDVKMTAIANLGHSEPDDRTDDFFKVIGIAGFNNPPHQWLFTDVALGPDPSIVGLMTDPGPMANMMGAAVHTAWRIDKLTFPTGLVNPPNQIIHLHQFNTDLCVEGCMTGDGQLWLANDAVVAEKFGVSHEVGHWLHKSWMFGTTGLTGNPGNPYDDFYNAPEGDEMCTYPESVGPGGHAMRSLEPGSAAFAESVAHFLAAMAWNSPFEEDGVFKYYKQQIPATSGQSMANDGWVVDLEADDDDPELPNPSGGNTRWRQTQCTSGDSDMPGTAPKYYATEMDWLRFWWDLMTDPASKHNGAQRPTTRQLFGFLRNTWDASEEHRWSNAWGVWEKMPDAASDAESENIVPDGFSPRFLNTARMNGINQL